MNHSWRRGRLGSLAGNLLLLFTLTLVAMPGRGALAAETAAVSPDTGKKFGVVWRIRGDVVANPGVLGRERRLKEGDAVFVGEHVRAEPAAEAALKTEDAGVIAIRPGAEFVAERFAAEGKPTDSLTLRLITGSLRVITGWIGRTNRAGHRIVTPSATIGIRGTDHEPYVLSPEMAADTANKEGTYDKVNRGRTSLEVGENSLEIDVGRVGFARAMPQVKKAAKERALLTMLLPVLLDKIPDFYVPGAFDAELDRYSETADETGLRQLEKMRKAPVAPLAQCSAKKLGKNWIGQLDKAISRLDAPAIVAMFAPDVVVRASVRRKDGGLETIELGRDELAQSTLTAIQSLQNYRHRRISIVTRPVPEAGKDAACDRLSVRSVVIEQGRQGGKPFRFESQEDYVLELRDGKWLAVKAETVQR